MFGRLGESLLEAELEVSPQLEAEFAAERRREIARERAAAQGHTATTDVPAPREHRA